MRLLKPSEFREARQRGKRYFSKNFIIYVFPNGLSLNRLGITASARVGNSVKRNRVKRLLREFFRLNAHVISMKGAVSKEGAISVDIAVYVKRNIDIKAMDLASVEGELEKIFFKDK
jgi:ribonuclease P protein component